MFRCAYGHFEFMVMFTNAPATFQALMNHVLRLLIGKGVIVYLDDILIYSKSKEEHYKLLRQVFALLRENYLFGKLTKCEFLKNKLEFLEHIISKNGIKADPQKVRAIVEWPVPTNVTELQSFLGLANFYQKFIKGYANITAPLTNLLQKDRTFFWTEECNWLFLKLKHKMTSAPVLKVVDPTLPY